MAKVPQSKASGFRHWAARSRGEGRRSKRTHPVSDRAFRGQRLSRPSYSRRGAQPRRALQCQHRPRVDQWWEEENAPHPDAGEVWGRCRDQGLRTNHWFPGRTACDSLQHDPWTRRASCKMWSTCSTPGLPIQIPAPWVQEKPVVSSILRTTTPSP